MIRSNYPLPGELPIEDQLKNRQEKESENRDVQEKIRVIQGGKVDKFLDEAKEHDGNFFQRIGSRVKEWYTERREDVKDEREGAQMEGRWYMMDRGSTFALDSAIAKQELVKATILDQQRREEAKFDKLAVEMGGNRRDIEDAKKKHLRSYEEKMKDAAAKHEALRKQLEEKQKEIQEIKVVLNERITRKIAAIQIESNYPKNKAEQNRLKDEIDKIEKAIDKHTKLNEKFAAISERLYGGSSIRKFFGKIRSESAVLNEEFADPDEEGNLPEEKIKIKEGNDRASKANSDIEAMMDGEKMSFENAAESALHSLEFHTRELTTLHRNLAKLKDAKEKIDTTVVHAEGRINSWEQHRRKLAIVDNGPGERMKAESFSSISELEDSAKNMLDKVRSEESACSHFDYWLDINSSKVLSGLDTSDKVKKHRIDSKVSKDQIAFSLVEIRDNMDDLAFEIDQNLDRIEATLQNDKLDPSFKKSLEKYKSKLAEKKKDIIEKYVNRIDKDPKNAAVQLEDSENRAIKYENLIDLAKDAGQEKPTSMGKIYAKVDRILELVDYSIDSVSELGSPEDKINAYIKILEYVTKQDGVERIQPKDSETPEEKSTRENIEIIYNRTSNLTLKLYKSAQGEMGNISDAKSRMQSGKLLLSVYDEVGGSLVPKGFCDSIRNSMYECFIGNLESLPEEERGVLLEEFCSTIEAYSVSGKQYFKNESSLDQCNQIKQRLFASIIKSTKDPVSAVKKMTDVSFILADKLKLTASETWRYEGFYEVMDFAKKIANDNENASLQPAHLDSTINDIGWSGENADIDGTSTQGTKRKAMQVEALDYIQTRLLESGLNTTYEKEPSGFVDVRPEHMIDLMKEVEGIRSVGIQEINHYADLAIKLDASGHFDMAQKVISKVGGLCEGQVNKLLQLASALSLSHHEPMRNEGMEMYEKSFELVSRSLAVDERSVSMAWNIVGSMIKNGFLKQAEEGIIELRSRKKGEFSTELNYSVDLHQLVSEFVEDESIAKKIKNEANTILIDLYRSAAGDKMKSIRIASVMDKFGESDAGMEVVLGGLKTATSSASEIANILTSIRLVQNDKDSLELSYNFIDEIADSLENESKLRFSPEELIEMTKVFAANGFNKQTNNLLKHFDALIDQDYNNDSIYPFIIKLAESGNEIIENKAISALDKIADSTKGNYDSLIKFADKIVEFNLSNNIGWLGDALNEAGAIAIEENDQERLQKVIDRMQEVDMKSEAKNLSEFIDNEVPSQDPVGLEISSWNDFPSADLDTSTPNRGPSNNVEATAGSASQPENPNKKRGIFSSIFGAFFGFLNRKPKTK